MTDAEIDALIDRIDEMARVIGCRFVPDPERLAAFRAQAAERRKIELEYERRLREAGRR